MSWPKGEIEPMSKKRVATDVTNDNKVKITASLTQEGIQGLNGISKQLGLSKSALIERIAKADFHLEGDVAKLSVNLKNTLGHQEEGDRPEVLVTSTVTEVSQDQNLLEQSASQSAEIAHLQAQLSQMVTRESYEALQKQSQVALDQLNQLNQKLQQQLKTATKSKDVSKDVSSDKNWQAEIDQLNKLNQQLQQQLQSTVTKEAYEALQKQSQVELDKLHERLAATVTKEAYDYLQQQSEKQMQEMQKRLEMMVARDAYEELQTQLQTQQQEFHQRLNNMVSKESYDHVLQQVESESQQLQHLQQQMTQMISPENYQQLQTAVQSHQQEIANFQQRLLQMQERDRIAGETVSKIAYDNLQREFTAQAEALREAQTRIAYLQSMTTIGESHLNKWRHRNFSH
jgi:hypothetical protein